MFGRGATPEIRGGEIRVRVDRNPVFIASLSATLPNR
jgi:hypothetical protein